MKTVAYLLILSLFSLFSLGAHASPIWPGNMLTNGLPPGTLNKTLLLKLINDVRRKGCQCGDTYYYPAPPLAWNEQLEDAAYSHSVDMYTKNYFNHIDGSGKKGGARIDAVGYHWKTYGENIGKGYTREKQVVDAWLKSPGHCKNIMNKAFTEMGVARVADYWTQDFATR